MQPNPRNENVDGNHRNNIVRNFLRYAKRIFNKAHKKKNIRLGRKLLEINSSGK